MTRAEVIDRALRLVVRLAENSTHDLEMCGCEAFEDDCVEARSIVAAAVMLLTADEAGR